MANMTTTGHRIVALLAARIVRCHSRRVPGADCWLGAYWMRDAQDAYRTASRSIRMARAGRLHGGSGPFGQGPASLCR
jgi:hypothetical protein